MPILNNCPNTVSAILPQGSTTTTVTWSEPTVSDNQPGFQTYANLESGVSPFVTGVTTVTYTATDQAGNQASCMFTVTVSRKYLHHILYFVNNVNIQILEAQIVLYLYL